MPYRDRDEHLLSRLRMLEAEAEERLREIDARTRTRLKEARARTEALLGEQRRENARLYRMLETRQKYRHAEDHGRRTMVYAALGVWIGSAAALFLWLALENPGLVLFCVLMSGLCGGAIGYFFDG